VKPSDLVHAAVSRGGEDVRARAFDAADALLGYVTDEAGAAVLGDPAARGTIFRALTSAFCGGYLYRETSPPKGEPS
jgi:hypothetical protein